MTSTDSATTAIPAPPAAQPAAAANTLSIVSLVLGIAGILLGQGIIAVAAIVLGFIARSREPQAITTANWGLALGFVGVFGGILFSVLAFFGFAPLFIFGSLPFWDVWGFEGWGLWG
jgi:hypothetical protein